MVFLREVCRPVFVGRAYWFVPSALSDLDSSHVTTRQDITSRCDATTIKLSLGKNVNINGVSEWRTISSFDSFLDRIIFYSGSTYLFPNIRAGLVAQK